VRATLVEFKKQPIDWNAAADRELQGFQQLTNFYRRFREFESQFSAK